MLLDNASCGTTSTHRPLFARNSAWTFLSIDGPRGRPDWSAAASQRGNFTERSKACVALTTPKFQMNDGLLTEILGEGPHPSKLRNSISRSAQAEII
jgi:hypothetical protein